VTVVATTAAVEAQTLHLVVVLVMVLVLILIPLDKLHLP